MLWRVIEIRVISCGHLFKLSICPVPSKFRHRMASRHIMSQRVGVAGGDMGDIRAENIWTFYSLRRFIASDMDTVTIWTPNLECGPEE